MKPRARDNSNTTRESQKSGLRDRMARAGGLEADMIGIDDLATQTQLCRPSALLSTWPHFSEQKKHKHHCVKLLEWSAS